MKILFRTNIDRYKTNCFPEHLEMPPRIGETVMVVGAFINYFKGLKLPTRMDVVDVIWRDDNVVVCELWYKQIDITIAELSGTNLF